MKLLTRHLSTALLVAAASATAQAQFHTMNFDAMLEGPLGASSYTEDGITVDSLDLYDGNGQGQPLGIERALLAFIGFPDFTSPNVLDFGTVTAGNLVSLDRFGSLRILPPVDSSRVDVRMYVLLGATSQNSLTLSAFQGATQVDTDVHVIPTGSGVHEVNLVVSGGPFTKVFLSTSGPNAGGTCLAVLDEIRSITAPVGLRFCYGDGSGAACPCNNFSLTPSGCVNSTGEGALSYAYGSSSLSLDQMEFGASLLPPGVPALLFSSGAMLGAGGGTPFGDGLRCIGGSIQRLGVKPAGANGRVDWDDQLLSRSGIGVGSNAFFQVWYRDTQGPCGSGFNLTNGNRVTITN